MINKFDPEQYINELVIWLNQSIKDYKAQSFVLGISGGIDSAVTACILGQTNYPCMGLILPTAISSAQDIKDAHKLIEHAKISYQNISIEPAFSVFMQDSASLSNPNNLRQNVIAGNVQARLRMMYLYAYAQNHDAMVVGTDNACEWHMGYFTKFGDGAADITPLIYLLKSQVIALAEYLKIPTAILDKAPSAGLWEGQTDEDEMGVTYQDIEAHLKGEKVSKHALESIAFWHNRSHHKRCLPLSPSHINQK